MSGKIKVQWDRRISESVIVMLDQEISRWELLFCPMLSCEISCMMDVQKNRVKIIQPFQN